MALGRQAEHEHDDDRGRGLVEARVPGDGEPHDDQ